MTRLILPALLAANALLAQSPVRVDLSGEWRMIRGEDRPEFAQPEFDDRSWETVQLPTGNADLFRLGDLWLRRQVKLPQEAMQRPLALTLGMFRGAYEVNINGRRIGGIGSRDSFADVPIPRAHTFPIPAAVLDTPNLLISIRVRHGLLVHRVHQLADEGPYLISDLALAPSDAGDSVFEKRRAEQVPLLVFAAVFFCLSLASLLGWWSEPTRRELGWLSLLCFSRMVAAVMITVYLFPSAYPFNRAGIPILQYLPQVLYQPLLGELVIAALCYRQRWLHAMLWLGWSPLVASIFLTPNLGGWWPRSYLLSSTQFSALWVALLASLLIIRDWLRMRRQRQAGPEEHALRFVLLLPALSIIERTLTEAARRNGWRRESFLAESFMAGPYSIERIDLFWLVAAALMIGLLLRRVAADRTERQRLAQELEAASQVQRLLVSGARMGGEDLEMAAHYLPAQEVGGDFYHVLNGRLLVVGDVSGKGLKAAMLVSLVTGVLRDTSERDPAGVLGALNRALAGHIEGFVTCCCAHFGADGAVTVANAGHLPPYIDGIEAAVESGLPLGLVAETCYEQTQHKLAPGSMLTVVSDGVVEAENAQRELFGFERTLEISGKSAQAIAEAAKAWGQNDDITVVTVRRNV